ncbi:hypothetical protein B7463_g8789, partial [Scytalidium lignicola]
MLQYQSTGRRRNGKQQACEPCRKGKMACDHAIPFCGRCVRRKMTSTCIYHPAPMTRAKPSSGLELRDRPTGLTRTSESSNTLESHSLSENPPKPPSMTGLDQSLGRFSIGIPIAPTISKPTEALDANKHPESRPSNSSTTTYSTLGSSNSEDTSFQRSWAYHGPTSIFSVYTEHQAKFQSDLLNVGEYEGCLSPLSEFSEPLGSRLELVVKALQNLPSKEICERLLATYEIMVYEVTLDEVIMRHCVATLWSTFEAQLKSPRNPDQLVTIARVLFKNEESPLPPAPPDGLEWINTFTGSNLRLEVLGNLFAFFGSAYLSKQDEDPIFNTAEAHGHERKQVAWRMKECADLCLKMCECTDTINEFVVALTVELLVLESTCVGDEDYTSRRRHADMITTTIAAGLHRLPDYSSNQITPACEYRKRVFAAVYTMDKMHCSLTGVPPGMTRFYCIVQLPLDLDNDELYLPEHELRVAISKLDNQGWNTAGKFHQITAQRLLMLLASIREEILELSLGVNVSITAERISDMHERCQQIYSSAPEQAHYYDEEAVPRGLADGQGILDAAMEMIEITNMFWIRRESLVDFSFQFDWFSTCYGVPSSGVICIELLKQSKRHSQSSLRFSRSDAIQKLMMFKGFLEWIKPTHGNYELAQRLHKVIGRITDHVLGEQDDNVKQHNEGDVLLDPTFPTLEEADYMDWLNGIDWTQGPWMEFNQTLAIYPNSIQP